MPTSHFEVSKRGLSQILARRGFQFAVLELVQNGLDAVEEQAGEGKRVDVKLERAEGYAPGHWRMVVTDNAPRGFTKLTHAYTLFESSAKKDNPELRGRFNLGEKLVIAASVFTRLSTTKGTLTFDDEGRHESKQKREHGTEVEVVLRMTREQATECELAVRAVLVPMGVTLTLNGEALPQRAPLAEFKLSLPTEVADGDGMLRERERVTNVQVFEVGPDEVPTIYELGMPVVATENQWHISVGQKVPINLDRDNVNPAYLKRLRVAVVNAMHERMSKDTATQPWVGDALAAKGISTEAVASILHQRYGEKVVTFDMSDKEANKLAVAQGYTVIPSGAYSKEQWANIREAKVALPAGQVTPSAKAWGAGEKPLTMVPMEKWTPDMLSRVLWVRELARVLLGVESLRVGIVNEPTEATVASYGKQDGLKLNLGRLGYRWFSGAPTEKVISLIIHEFAHHYSGDHLSEEYHEACCNLGARLALLTMTTPHLLHPPTAAEPQALAS